MIKLLGLPFDNHSSFLKGPAFAPQRIRLMDKEGSANRFAENGDEIVPGENYNDSGDIYFEDTNPQTVFDTIKSKAAAEIENGDKLISLGGDHSVSYPLIDAFSDKYKDLHILHFDAHADLYDNFENNPFSHASPFARIMEQGKVKSLTQVGIRTLSNHQRQQAEKFGVNILEMKDFNMDFISHLKSPLYISVDLDVLDPAFAPGISHHEPGGLSTRQLIDCIQQIKVNIVGADLVEYNPIRDLHNMTAMVAYKIFKELAAVMLK